MKALLRAFDDAGSFLETPAGGPRPLQEISLSFLQPIDKEDCLGTIGPYEVLEVIGRGGMGVVLRAVDLKLNRIVAVKVLIPEPAANPNARKRFLREAQAAAAISHPYVVTIHAVEEAHGDGTERPVPPYLVMECVVGQSLQEKLDNVGSLRLAENLRISRQIAEGPAAAHKQGLIHQDIKPANILLENGVERVKITDFGLAQAIDDITVTRTGEVSGTPQYMSPEQASGKRVDHRSDLFSLGCVMDAMCTGHSPFRGDSLAHVIKRVTQDTPRPITEQNPDVPPWLVQIIDCLLQKGPDQRFQSAEGLVVILEQHLARIQQPADSGSHSVINQQMGVKPATAASFGQPMFAATPTAEAPPGRWRYVGALLIFFVAGGTLSTILIPDDVLSTDPDGAQRSLIRYTCFMLGIFFTQLLMYKIKIGSAASIKPWLLFSSVALGTMLYGFICLTVFCLDLASRTWGEATVFIGVTWLVYCFYVMIELCDKVPQEVPAPT